MPEHFQNPHCSEILTEFVNFRIATGRYPESAEILITDNPWRQPAEIIKEKLEIIRPNNKDDYQDASPDAVIEQIEDWFKLSKFRIMLEDGVREYNKNSFDSINVLRQQADEINAFSFQSQEWIDTDDIEKMIQIHSEQVPRVKTSWDALNEVTGGGFKTKSVNVVQGGTHSGKSRWLLSLATSFRKCAIDNNVLYITLEISDKDFSIYSDMHMLEMMSADIQSLVMTNPDEYRKRKKKFAQENGKLFLQEIPASQCTVSLVKSIVDRHLSRGIPITAVMIDYIGIMKAENPKANMYERGASNIIGIRSISQEYGIPFFTAVQPDRDGNRRNQKNGEGADLMNVSESKSIPDTSDFFANIIQTPDMYKANTQIMNILKNRHGGKIYEPLLMEVTKNLYKVDIVGKGSMGEDCPVEQGEQQTPGAGGFGFTTF